MAKPTIVCVPGAWHRPEIYEKTLKILGSHGYPTIGLPLSSVGALPAHQNFDKDVEGIRKCLSNLTEIEEKDVILVVHSYSGMPGAEAPKGLGSDERQKKGLKGGVIRVVFIMAFAMPEGFNPTGTGAQFPEWMKLDAERGVVDVDAEDAKRIFYNDLSDEEGNKWAAKLQSQSVGVYTSTTTYASWRDIPSTYVIGKSDKSAITRDLVDFMIGNAREMQPKAFDVVEACDGGHCLMISQSEWLADVLRRAAGESF